MADASNVDAQNLGAVQRWCELKGQGWSVLGQLGCGATAAVFEIASPEGPRALKLCSAAFSTGAKGVVEKKRIDQQLELRAHNCPSLVQVYEGGKFEDRLYLLMSRAPGKELEKRLQDIPRDQIRHIVDQVAKAAMFLRDRNRCHRDIKAANIFISDDFNQVTLLDISVIRDIYDPVGVGTDHDGQLPIVATARYAPPEYLFRLLESGPDLWNALSIYQLGALLHDLIMRTPLFEAEYLRSVTNRYRFAWIVATAKPLIQAHDVDQDLVFTAQRALDKNWKRRSTLSLEDFLADSKVQHDHALQFFGLAGSQGGVADTEGVATRLERLRSIARLLEDAIRELLRTKEITATHSVKPGTGDNSKVLEFRWDWAGSGADGKLRSMELEVELTLSPASQGQNYLFTSSAKLHTVIDGQPRSAAIELPELTDETGVEGVLVTYVEAALPTLAVQLAQAKSVK